MVSSPVAPVAPGFWLPVALAHGRLKKFNLRRLEWQTLLMANITSSMTEELAALPEISHPSAHV